MMWKIQWTAWVADLKSVSQIEEKVDTGEHTFNDTLKMTRTLGIQMQQLLDDSKKPTLNL